LRAIVADLRLNVKKIIEINNCNNCRFDTETIITTMNCRNSEFEANKCVLIHNCNWSRFIIDNITKMTECNNCEFVYTKWQNKITGNHFINGCVFKLHKNADIEFDKMLINGKNNQCELYN